MSEKDTRSESDEELMRLGERIRVQYDKLDDFTFPILKIVCQPRGRSDTWNFFEAHCPSCGQYLNGEGLVVSASNLVMMREHPIPGARAASGCPHCGDSTLIAKLIDVTPKEIELLQRDRHFSKLFPDESCFIATACYGRSTCHEVKILRSLRDQFLATNKIGLWFIKLYYACSPRIAYFISQHNVITMIVRTSILNPIVFAVSWFLECTNKSEATRHNVSKFFND